MHGYLLYWEACHMYHVMFEVTCVMNFDVGRKEQNRELS